MSNIRTIPTQVLRHRHKHFHRFNLYSTMNDGMDPPLPIHMPPPSRNNAPTPNALAPVTGTCQNCPMAECPGLFHTPPRDLEFRRIIASSNRSVISTLTTDDPLSNYAAVAASTRTTPLSGNKHPALDLPPDLSPSPSKHYPDYSFTKSSGDSVASGDDSL